jgi:hypothetical protein
MNRAARLGSRDCRLCRRKRWLRKRRGRRNGHRVRRDRGRQGRDDGWNDRCDGRKLRRIRRRHRQVHLDDRISRTERPCDCGRKRLRHGMHQTLNEGARWLERALGCCRGCRYRPIYGGTSFGRRGGRARRVKPSHPRRGTSCRALRTRRRGSYGRDAWLDLAHARARWRRPADMAHMSDRGGRPRRSTGTKVTCPGCDRNRARKDCYSGSHGSNADHRRRPRERLGAVKRRPEQADPRPAHNRRRQDGDASEPSAVFVLCRCLELGA